MGHILDLVMNAVSAPSSKTAARIFLKICIYDTMCRSANYQDILTLLFIFRILALLNLEFILYIEFNNEQFLSGTFLESLHRFSKNVVGTCI